MSVLVYVDSPSGQIKKSGQEVVTYGKKVAEMLGTDCIALTLGDANNAGELGVYGASKVINVADASLNAFDSQAATSVIAQVAANVGANVVIMSHNAKGKAVVGRIAARMDAGSVAGVNALPSNDGSFKVKKNVFSGKAIANYEITSENKVLSVMGNSVPPEATGSAVEVESMAVEVPASKITVKEIDTVKGIVPLPEAELVVSAGRGMKGPENWGIIEELANELAATTACSRPVADVGWRPHHEHVGQTGVAIRPNLYFAIGISGAIQHLAGVNSSKTIVVINKDPEAPFFKAADYGVVADLFDVVPKLTEAIRKFKAAQA